MAPFKLLNNDFSNALVPGITFYKIATPYAHFLLGLVSIKSHKIFTSKNTVWL